jgi:hypothetical protein
LDRERKSNWNNYVVVVVVGMVVVVAAAVTVKFSSNLAYPNADLAAL